MLSLPCNALAKLDYVPWSAKVPGLSRAVSLYTRELASIVTNRWFTDETMNAGLDYIIRRIAQSNTPSTHALVNSFWHLSVKNRFDETGAYCFRRKSVIDQGIRSEQISVLKVPLNPGKHDWAGLRIDLTTGEYCFRDSLARKPPNRELRRIEQYLRVVLPGDDVPAHNLRPAAFPRGSHQIARQRDNFLCGPAYLSSLAEEYIGGPEWQPSRAREARMSWFLRLGAGFVPSSVRPFTV